MKFVRYIPQGFQKHGKWVEENLLAIERKDWQTSSFS
jgi:ribosomal-protein-alanine N-acetyltransferase